MAENDSIVPKELPPAMRTFLENERNVTFTEEDIKMFNRSHEIWKEHGMKFVIILLFRALPYTYMAERPAKCASYDQTARRTHGQADY